MTLWYLSDIWYGKKTAWVKQVGNYCFIKIMFKLSTICCKIMIIFSETVSFNEFPTNMLPLKLPWDIQLSHFFLCWQQQTVADPPNETVHYSATDSAAYWLTAYPIYSNNVEKQNQNVLFLAWNACLTAYQFTVTKTIAVSKVLITVHELLHCCNSAYWYPAKMHVHLSREGVCIHALA